MAAWWQSVETALQNLNGKAQLKRLYEEVRSVRTTAGLSTPTSLNAIVRKELEYNSSDSSNWQGRRDLFFSVDGLGAGVWGLRKLIEATPSAVDLTTSDNNLETERVETSVYRILRDTPLARKLKLVHQNKCQICGETIRLSDGREYSEAHHIMPLGNPHNGPDISTNIIILCPNHHVILDYGAMTLDPKKIVSTLGHRIGEPYIQYHNEFVCGAKKP
ncbi:HNH endonuclease [Nitratireductor sp. XY-223]|uniref:HNH endonuclease n=1 Tax=Nitratireductor sp. XY-223 TaxID=2561926 RepID=UPI0010A9F70C|nr:HNH endonuclease [Nitratireductor sp. XY-223]